MCNMEILGQPSTLQIRLLYSQSKKANEQLTFADVIPEWIYIRLPIRRCAPLVNIGVLLKRNNILSLTFLFFYFYYRTIQ